MLALKDIKTRNEKISVIGLGYVGLPIAVSFANVADVVGFDTNEAKISQYRNGSDLTNEVGDEAVRNTSVLFTHDPGVLRTAKFHIVAVPTPIHSDKTPDLSLIETACHILGRNLEQGSVIVFESTVYPGVTEEICVPILEKESGLSCGTDFKIGYSPERINPGDKLHRLENIVKIVSGMDTETLDVVAGVYEMIIEAGVYRASSIRTAEAAKVIENSQRDVNIAFMNEIAMIFHRLGIDTLDVLSAAKTKWNFLDFKPGLVGGHCIGVDPYYLTHRAEQKGFHSKIITYSRQINDDMGKYVANITIKKMINTGIPIKNSRIGILGFTFKENCSDTRNTKVIDIIHELQEYGAEVLLYDPFADVKETKELYGLCLTDFNCLNNLDCVVLAVAHNKIIELSSDELHRLFRSELSEKILIDIKGAKREEMSLIGGFSYWCL